MKSFGKSVCNRERIPAPIGSETLLAKSKSVKIWRRKISAISEFQVLVHNLNLSIGEAPGHSY